MNAGCTMRIIPIKPKKTADQRLIPTFSDKNTIDAMVTKIGPPKVSDTTSANGKCLKPKKIQTKAIDPQIALKACRPGLFVL